MSHKRKRSHDSESPLSTSSVPSRSSASPSPPDAFFQTYPSPAFPWVWNQQQGRTNDSGRTRKRYRDGRPDERVIHQTTLQKLFIAQTQHLDTAGAHQQPTPLPSPTAPTHHPVQKSTLHQFWRIAQPLSLDPAASSHPASFEDPLELRCENCAVALSGGEAMDVDMDSSGEGDEFACRRCGRKVCGNCSIARDVRSCLGCATS